MVFSVGGGQIRSRNRYGGGQNPYFSTKTQCCHCSFCPEGVGANSIAGFALHGSATAPTAQWVTSGEDWSHGRQPRQKIRQGAMPQGRSRPSSSKQPDTYSTPAWRVAGGMNLLTSFLLNCGQRLPVPQRSFRDQQRLEGPLDAWTRKRLRCVGGRPRC